MGREYLCDDERWVRVCGGERWVRVCGDERWVLWFCGLDVWCAAAYLERYGGDTEGVGFDVECHHACAGVEGTLLVEDEVADAVVDVTSAIYLHGLHGVCVMADDAVSSGIDECVCQSAL